MDDKKRIEEYLEKLSKEDYEFYSLYHDESRGKTIDECYEYIKAKALSVIMEGRTNPNQVESCLISDSHVFGWAEHYYREENYDDIQEEVKKLLKNATSPTSTNNHTIDDKTKQQPQNNGILDRFKQEELKRKKLRQKEDLDKNHKDDIFGLLFADEDETEDK